MKIVGCDLHTRYQQVAMLVSGEVLGRGLRRIFRSLGPTLVCEVPGGRRHPITKSFSALCSLCLRPTFHTTELGSRKPFRSETLVLRRASWV